MAEFNEENKVNGVYGGVNFNENEQQGQQNQNGGEQNNRGVGNETAFRKVEASELPTKPSIWSKIRTFLFQEIDLNAPIKIELTPYQQKVENEINEFLHQEVSFKGFFNLFKKSNA